MSAEVIVPYGGSCRHRAAAWAHCRPRWAWPVREAPIPAGEAWSKGRALWPVLESSTADIVVVADADVTCDGVGRAIMAVAAGLADWAMPHRYVRRLDQASTAQVFAGAEPNRQMGKDRPAYEGVIGGGIIVARRAVLLDCPLDPRFIGWGQEDLAIGIALTCLYGQPWRGQAELYHLWHPPAERISPAKGSRESAALFNQYRHARRDPEAMRQIVEEVHVALTDDLHSVHAPAGLAG